MTRRGPRRGRLGRVVGNITPTLIVLLALEILARVGAWAWHGGNEYYLLYGIQGLAGRVSVSPWSVYDGRHFKFPPDYTLESAAGQGRETARTNSLGFRGPDFSPTKTPGTFRVVTLGGSSTFGFHNEDDETYPSYLQAVLDRAGEGSGGPVEVINAGFPYYTTASIRSLLEREVIEYEPDVLTLYSAYNDASWPLHLSPFLRALFRVQQHSGIYLVLKETLLPDARVYQFQKRWRSRSLKSAEMARIDADAERIAARYRRNVEAILDLARSRAVPVLLVRQPMTTATVNRQFAGLPYEEEYRLVREQLERGAYSSPFEIRMVYHHRLLEELDRIARERELPVVDNVALTDANPGSLTTWVHLTAEANRRLAEALGQAIVELRARAPAAGQVPRSSFDTR